MNSFQAVKRLRFEGGVAVEAILVETQRKQHAQAIKPYLLFHYIPHHQQQHFHHIVKRV